MRRLLFSTALALSLALAPALRAAIPFPQDESDMRADPVMHFGTLPNGLRYVIVPNHEPKERVSLRLLVLSGSFQETDAQRGLAHFLEHMAFNGSTHYAPGTLVEKLQRRGMAFGADTNASTSFDRTLYQLELPDTSAASTAEGLQILADYAGGLLLEDKMVDKERGIILSEKRTRDSVQYRTFVAQLDFMEAGTRVPDRLPIGLSDVIEKSNRDPFVAFYNTWYRPERMVVIVVGDIDAAALEKQVVAGFSGITARSPEPKEVDMGSVAQFKGVRTLYHGEPEAPDTQVEIAAVTPYTRVPDTKAYELSLLPRMLALEMLNLRLEILSKKENAPFSRASASVEEEYGLYRESAIGIACKPDQWTAAMGVADQELRRALHFGFNPDGLKQVEADFRNQLEQAVKTAPTRRSDELAGQIADSLVDQQVFTSPADDLALFGPALDKVTAEQCAEALRAVWASPGRYVFVSGNLKLAGDPNQIVADTYEKAEAVGVGRTGERTSLAWDYTDFGKPGAVASRTHIDDLDITEVTFANGVRLNLKKTDFEANAIHVAARLGAGLLSEPSATKPGLSMFSTLTFSAGGLGRFGVDDLQRILAGKTVGLGFASTPDAFLFNGQTNKEDLVLELQLLAASISDPGYRAEAMRVARKRIDEAYLAFSHTERGPLSLEVPKLLSSGDPRFALPPKDEMMSRSLDELRAWLGPQLATGALEVSIAGDIDIDATIEAASKTVGALPAREPKPAFADRKKVKYPSTPFTKEFNVDTKIPKGVIAVYWPTDDGMDIHRSRRLNMLGEVLEDRLRVKVREQLGGTYSPQTQSSASDLYPGYGYISALCVVDPAKTKLIEDAVVAAAADLYANGVTQDELDRAKNPTLKALKESERTNGYWMTVLGRAQERPEVLDWARSREADFASISKADLDALAKAYLSPDKASHVVIRPYLSPGMSPVVKPTGPTKLPPPPADG